MLKLFSLPILRTYKRNVLSSFAGKGRQVDKQMKGSDGRKNSRGKKGRKKEASGIQRGEKEGGKGKRIEKNEMTAILKRLKITERRDDIKKNNVERITVREAE